MTPLPSATLPPETLREIPGESRWRGLAVSALVIAALPLVLPNAWYTDVAIHIAIQAVNAIALNLLIGFTGQISLGHAGFFGIGAYGSAILTSRYGLPPLAALALAATVTGVLALGLAGPILRLKGHSLAMATLGFGIIVSIVLTNEAAWTGGPDGLSVDGFGIGTFRLVGEKAWYWVFAGLLLAAIALAQNLVDSPAGRAIQALHGSETAAAIAGIDVKGYKTAVFVLSAVVVSIMGSLSAHYTGYINPGIANFMMSVEVVTMVVLGGMASIWGSVVGAVLLGLLPQVLAGYEGWDTVVFGAILGLTVIFMPRGIVPTLATRFRRAAR
jgi:branched-chain amino acid transport system permease protein